MDLAKHLGKIMKEEKKMVIPNNPPVDVPKRREMSMLKDDLTDGVKKLDNKYFQYESEFREYDELLRKELESEGEGSMFSSM